MAGLSPGQYKLTVRLPGLSDCPRRVGAVLDSEKGLSLDFAMELLALHEVVTVASGHDEIDPSNGDSLFVTRGSPGAPLPTNGSDYRMLFDLMPGIVVTPAGVNDGGQFTSNGQRPNANAFRVDGVSANTGVGGSTLPGSFPGASLPAMSAIGSTENLGSSETAQSVELRTSGFAPELGGRLGSQALVTSRSGSNAFHAEFFGNVRDDSWNARDWFANSYGLAYPRPSYRDFGGVFGGPIVRNRTFFFLSIENSQLNDSALELTSVPSIATRQNAPAALQAILASFPVPTGPDLGGEAEGLIGYSRRDRIACELQRTYRDQALDRGGLSLPASYNPHPRARPRSTRLRESPTGAVPRSGSRRGGRRVLSMRYASIIRAPISARRSRKVHGGLRLSWQACCQPRHPPASGLASPPCSRNRPPRQVCGECPSLILDSLFRASMGRADKTNGSLTTRSQYK